MAIMASPPPEPAKLDTKPVEMVSETDQEEQNGRLEVNGHRSPLGEEPVAKSAATAATPEPKENGQSGNASTPNGKSISKTPKTEPAKATVNAKTRGHDSVSDTEMPDTQADQPDQADEATSPTEHPVRPADTASERKLLEKVSSSSNSTGDVEMNDSSPAPILPATQDTAASDLPPATPAEELALHPASMSSLAIDTTQASPGAARTADTSMSDPPHSPVKVARGREEEENDERAAKRVKTDPPGDVVEVKTTLDNRMSVDQPVGDQVSLFKEDGEAKNLADPSLDGNSINAWQARSIRGLLAGIKKTKAGSHFKMSVQAMWPALWDDYKAKITDPTDITTMERRLKGDPAYLPYHTMGEFKKDVQRLYENALKFNGEVHEVTTSARIVQDQLLEKMAAISAVAPESAKEEKKAVKQHPTRHTEPRATGTTQQSQSPAQPARRQSKPAATSPVEKPAESPAFAIPPNNNGVPLIRRDSAKNADDRPKRPIHPPKSKDLGYEPKKKKLSPDLRFCDEVLNELRKQKYFDFNQYFIVPVDPIALNIPNYHKVIKKPMDLQTMSEKLNTGQYSSSKDFEKDFNQIIKNCKTFNGETHLVTQRALELENLFKTEWAKKDDWVAKHAPATVAPAPPQASAPSPHANHYSEDDDVASEPDEDEKEQTSPHLEALLQRLKKENDNLSELMMQKKPDMAAFQVSQTMVTLLQKQIVEERQKLADSASTKKPAKPKAAASKSKKSSGGGKKAVGSSTAAGSSATGSGGGASKKSGGSAKKASHKRVMGAVEKEVIAAAISDLDGNQLERAIEIIKKDTNQNENDSGELELDIEVLSQDALTKLYDISIKAFPHLRAEKERHFVAPPPPEPPAAKARTSSKPKKNKPMGKAEQERRLQQLSELKAALKARGSGSQEPLESIEGNGGPASVAGPSDRAPQPVSDEDESSEEE